MSKRYAAILLSNCTKLRLKNNRLLALYSFQLDNKNTGPTAKSTASPHRHLVGCDGWGSRLTIYIAKSPIIVDHHRSPRLREAIDFSNGKHWACRWVYHEVCDTWPDLRPAITQGITRQEYFQLTDASHPHCGKGQESSQYNKFNFTHEYHTSSIKYWATTVIASNHFVFSHRAVETADSCLDFESHSVSRRLISLDVCSSVMEVDTTSGCGDCFIGWDDVTFLDDDTASAQTDGHYIYLI